MGALELQGGHLAAYDGGHDDKLYVLLCMGKADDHPVERHAACDWRVSVVGADSESEYIIPGQRANYNFAQPLHDGLLLATGRCKFEGPDTRPNAFLFDLAGNPTGSILIGDGVQHLQTSPHGQIWAGYFDEGIYGNYGWSPTTTIGESGLVRFEMSGAVTYRFAPAGGLEPCGGTTY